MRSPVRWPSTAISSMTSSCALQDRGGTGAQIQGLDQENVVSRALPSKGPGGHGQLNARLASSTGFQVEQVNSGCCGMAGSFGYEKEHYRVSMDIGNLALFPAVRAKGPGVGNSGHGHLVPPTNRTRHRTQSAPPGRSIAGCDPPSQRLSRPPSSPPQKKGRA